MGLHDDDDLGMEDGDGMDEMEDQLQGSYMGNDEMGESKLTGIYIKHILLHRKLLRIHIMEKEHRNSLGM